MADWPRSIRPEDRIKYLINARTQIGQVVWDRIDGRVVMDQAHWVWVVEAGDSYEGWYSDRGAERLVGEFQDMGEAQKALVDLMVVNLAVGQAWEDVAS